MSDFFIHIYRFFQKRKTAFYLLLGLASLSIVIIATRIGFEEDISQSVSNKGQDDNTNYVVRNLKLSDKLIVDFTLADSLAPADPDRLKLAGQRFVDSLKVRFDTGTIRNITFNASDSAMDDLMDLVMEHLPVFFDEGDYISLDSILQPDAIEKALEKDYKILVSPASMVLKKRIQQDPLGISNIAFAKLKSLRAGDNFEIRNGCIYSGDFRHLLIIIEPTNPSAETHRNEKLIAGLDDIIRTLTKGQHQQVRMQYFGGVAVAVCNARQLKKAEFHLEPAFENARRVPFESRLDRNQRMVSRTRSLRNQIHLEFFGGKCDRRQ